MLPLLTIPGSYGRGSDGSATGINDSGVIVGFSGDEGFTAQATLWRGGRVENLGSPTPFGVSEAVDINNQDVVVGDRDFHAFIWTATSGGVDINPVGADESSARAINDRNWAVGYIARRRFEAEDDRAALWLPNADAVNLNSLVDFSYSTLDRLSVAEAINEFGEIVGTGTGRDGLAHGFCSPRYPKFKPGFACCLDWCW